MVAVLGNFFTHDHNALAVAEQEYRHAQQNHLSAQKYRFSQPDKLKHAEERLAEAHGRYLRAMDEYE